MFPNGQGFSGRQDDTVPHRYWCTCILGAQLQIDLRTEPTSGTLKGVQDEQDVQQATEAQYDTGLPEQWRQVELDHPPAVPILRGATADGGSA